MLAGLQIISELATNKITAPRTIQVMVEAAWAGYPLPVGYTRQKKRQKSQTAISLLFAERCGWCPAW
jgi:hypothetical protein